MVNYPLLVVGVPVLLALTVDGIEQIYRSLQYKKNKKFLDQFRAELEALKPEKTNFGIAIPCYRNPQVLDSCLYELINNVGISPENIAVVDDHSDDNGKTINMAIKYKVHTDIIDKYEKDVKKVRAQKKAVEMLYDLGKEYIIAMDSDTFIKAKKRDLEYIIQEMKIFDLDAMAVYLVPKINNDANLIEKIQKGEYIRSMKAYRGSMYSISSKNGLKPDCIDDLKEKYKLERAGVLMVSGAFGIFKSNLLLEILKECKSGFSGEDAEITWRALSKNAKIGYYDNIVVETEVPKNLKSFTIQRDLWAQYISSNYFNAPYTRDIYKKRKEKLDILGVKTSIAIQTIRDVLIHPIKLLYFPFLIVQPIVFVPLIAFYGILDLTTSSIIDEKREQNIAINFLVPPLRLYNLIIPRTIGYFKQLKRWLSQKY